MGWTVAIRLDENNKAILDYVLFHFPYVGGHTLRFYEHGHSIHKIERFETFDELTRSLVRRVKKATRSTPAKQQRSRRISCTTDRENKEESKSKILHIPRTYRNQNKQCLQGGRNKTGISKNKKEKGLDN
jgi:hypothetical protein